MIIIFPPIRICDVLYILSVSGICRASLLQQVRNSPLGRALSKQLLVRMYYCLTWHGYFKVITLMVFRHIFTSKSLEIHQFWLAILIQLMVMTCLLNDLKGSGFYPALFSNSYIVLPFVFFCI